MLVVDDERDTRDLRRQMLGIGRITVGMAAGATTFSSRAHDDEGTAPAAARPRWSFLNRSPLPMVLIARNRR